MGDEPGSQQPLAGALVPPRTGGEPSHIAALDGLRGIAILLVMFYHYFLGSEHHQPLINWLLLVPQCGWMGVDLFFVLSGFLITGILLRVKGRPHYFRDFYMRRTLRIFPLYYGVLLLMFGGGMLIPALNTPAFRQVADVQIWLWLYLSNVYNALTGQLAFVGDWLEANHFWSLAIEEQFYLVWPTVVLLCSRRALAWVCVVLIAGALLLRTTAALAGANAIFLNEFTFCRIDTLVLGGLLAVAALGPAGLEPLRRPARIGLPISIGVVAALFVARHGLHTDDVIVSTVGYSLLAFVFAAVLIETVSAAPGTRLRWFMTRPLLMQFGKYSYALYVFHWGLYPLFLNRLLPQEEFSRVFRSYLLGMCVRFVALSACAFLIAWLSWHLYEKHFLKLKRFFEYRRAE
jgi:peptidoglycan/LPS O-acetylase OafA/YrhL